MGETKTTPIVYRRPYSIIMMVGLKERVDNHDRKLAKYLLAQSVSLFLSPPISIGPLQSNS